MINIDDVKKVEITVGRILSAEVIEGSDKLLKLSVDFGEERPRTVVSGIRKHFENPSDLVGTKCGFVTNLEPRPLMGLTSEAMILAASTDTEFSLLRVDEQMKPGAKVK